MKTKQFPVILLLALLLSLLSCNNQPKKKSEDTKQKKDVVKIQVPKFSQDSAYQFVAEQVAFGPRVPNTKAHQECALYLENKMKEFTPDVLVQDFQARAYNGTILNGKNIISQFNKNAKKRILLASHWDSRPFADHDANEANFHTPIDGANDGASGVGILMELARLMSQENPKVGVDIVFLDLEDYGTPHFEGNSDNDSWALGSQYWANNPEPYGYTANFGILLDMVGAKDPIFLMEHYSMYYAPHIVKKVWKKAATVGYGQYFLFEDGGYVMDDHIPINENMKIPMIDIIHYDPSTESGFCPQWHTLDDNLEHIDPYTLGAVGEVITYVVYTE